MGPFDQFSKALAQRERLLAIGRGQFLPPASVKLELTYACNHDCHFCAYRRLVRRGRPELLESRLVLRLLGELARGGVRAVMFTGGGEPLLHPAIEEIFAACRELSLEHALLTNGACLGRLSDEAVRGLRWIRFSINAGDEETYARVHGVSPRQWHAVWEQVRRVAGLSRGRPELGVSCVVTARNLGGLGALADLARAHGAHYVHFRPAFVGPDTELERQLLPDEVEQAVARLGELATGADESFRVFGVERRFRELSAASRKHVHCRSTPLVAYVLPSADVSICTLVRSEDFSPRTPTPFLGNLRQASFFELWNSEHHHALIEALSSSGCGRCHFAEYNRALEVVARDTLHADFL